MILPDLLEKAQLESTASTTETSSSAASVAEEDPPYNYLANLINRPTLEKESDVEFRPAFQYSSLLNRNADTLTLADEDDSTIHLQQVCSPEPDVVVADYDDLTSCKSRNSSIIGPQSLPPPPKEKPQQPSRWSAKLLPKGFRRFSSSRGRSRSQSVDPSSSA